MTPSTTHESMLAKVSGMRTSLGGAVVPLAGVQESPLQERHRTSPHLQSERVEWPPHWMDPGCAGSTATMTNIGARTPSSSLLGNGAGAAIATTTIHHSAKASHDRQTRKSAGAGYPRTTIPKAQANTDLGQCPTRSAEHRYAGGGPAGPHEDSLHTATPPLRPNWTTGHGSGFQKSDALVTHPIAAMQAPVATR
jgi:hypothetical protein